MTTPEGASDPGAKGCPHCDHGRSWYCDPATGIPYVCNFCGGSDSAPAESEAKGGEWRFGGLLGHLSEACDVAEYNSKSNCDLVPMIHLRAKAARELIAQVARLEAERDEWERKAKSASAAYVELRAFDAKAGPYEEALEKLSAATAEVKRLATSEAEYICRYNAATDTLAEWYKRADQATAEVATLRECLRSAELDGMRATAESARLRGLLEEVLQDWVITDPGAIPLKQRIRAALAPASGISDSAESKT